MDAKAGKQATLRLEAETETATAYQYIAYLPGVHYGTAEDKQILLVNHTDGPSITQDNGALGLLAIVKYFSHILQVVDYKSEAQGADWHNTAEIRPSAVDASHKMSYKRQMDMYIWIARQRGLRVSDTGYFLYVNAMHKGRDGMLIDEDSGKAWMESATKIIPYEADTSCVEPVLFEIKELLENQKTCPEVTTEPTENAPYGSENGRFLLEAMEALGR